MKRLIIIGALTLMSCTPYQAAQWQAWWAKDPAAAIAYAEAGCPGTTGCKVEQQLTNNHAAEWDRIARCESGGRWDYPLVTNSTGTYSGGLMIWTKAWAAYGGHEFAPNAYQATKAQQIEIAERILADQGWGAWDCA